MFYLTAKHQKFITYPTTLCLHVFIDLFSSLTGAENAHAIKETDSKMNNILIQNENE